MVLDRETILEADDASYELVPVPEWGGEVRVRSLTGWERDQYESSINIQQGGGKSKLNLLNARAKLAALVCVGDDGNRLFSDDDALALGKKSAFALNRIFDVATKLSGLSESDVQELGLGLEEGPTGDMSSDSRPFSDAQSTSS